MTDPFEILGVEPRFDLDLPALERRHRDLSRALHPDRHADGGPRERRLALSRAVEVNEAFRALRDPLRRAEALLARLGAPLEEGTEPRPSPAFLGEVLELREALEAATRAKDGARVESLASRTRATADRTSGALAAALASGDAERARVLLGELRYARRFLDEASAAEDELTGS